VDAKDLIAMVKQKLEGWNVDDIINMDEMPIPFSYHSNKMLDVKRNEDNPCKSINDWYKACHFCSYHNGNWENVATIPHFQRQAKRVNCHVGVLNIPCCRTICMSGQGLDGWGKDAWVVCYSFEDMKGCMSC
jgi:hypothetical protein